MNGTVCLQGGGEFSAACRAMDADLLVRAGGRVVVTALAGVPGRDYETATANGVRHFIELGARDVVGAADVRESPERALEALRTARLLVLPGGSPARLLDALQTSGVDQLIAELSADGALLMGASAGAMVLCGWLVLPDRGMRVVRGLGLVSDVVVVPHWSGERADWLAALEAAIPPQVTVLGVPEESGVLVAGSQLTAVGRTAAVSVRDGRELPR